MEKKVGLIIVLLLIVGLTSPLLSPTLVGAAVVNPPIGLVCTNWINPSSNAADTGGDNDGFEVNPTNVYADDANYSSNIDGTGDRHRYDYNFSIPAGSTIYGILVRLDWWLDSDEGTNYIDVDLSWDGGTNWTSTWRCSVERTDDGNPTCTVGHTLSTWGHTWDTTELSTANFRVRLTCYSSSDDRDFYLDWVPFKVCYVPPGVEICDDETDNDDDGDIDCADSDCLVDEDEDGYNAEPCGGDCDDDNANINPDALEVCDDGIDNDCDEDIDCADSDCVCGSIGDTVFYDTNGNGIQDPGENGIADVDVKLYRDDNDGVFDPEGDTDELIDSTATDANGTYLFDVLPPFCDDGYWVLVDEVTLPGDVTLTTDNPILVCLGEGEDYEDADFPCQAPTAPAAVGGETYPADKLAILAPWIALAVAIIAGAAILVRRRRT